MRKWRNLLRQNRRESGIIKTHIFNCYVLCSCILLSIMLWLLWMWEDGLILLDWGRVRRSTFNFWLWQYQCDLGPVPYLLCNQWLLFCKGGPHDCQQSQSHMWPAIFVGIYYVFTVLFIFLAYIQKIGRFHLKSRFLAFYLIIGRLSISLTFLHDHHWQRQMVPPFEISHIFLSFAIGSTIISPQLRD